MTTPSQTWAVLPAWNVRLLARIHALAAQRTHVRREGHRAHPGGMDGWRNHLEVLDAAGRDAEIQAASLGIPGTLITEAREQGRRELRWSGHRHRPDVAGVLPSALHEGIDELANTVWKLEHMAALSVARRDRHSLKGVSCEPDSTGAAQFQRNVAALWVRARTLVESLPIPAAEREGLWMREPAQWRVLMAATVHTYDDYVLDLIWTDHADPAIEAIAVRLMSGHGPDEHLSAVHRRDLPPTPHQMLAHASHALGAQSWPHTTPADHPIGSAIEADLPSEAAIEWTTDPATEPWTADPSHDP